MTTSTYSRQAQDEIVEAIVEMMFDAWKDTTNKDMYELGARKHCMNNAKNYLFEAGHEMGWGREKMAKKYYDLAMSNIVAAYQEV